MDRLDGKVAFVTGGASGIGLGIALACVEAGTSAVLADVRADHLELAAEAFDERGLRDRVLAVELDVTDRGAFARAADAAEEALGPVDVVVANAGVGILGSIRDAGYDDWDWGLGVNLGGAVNALQTFLPRLLARGEGGHVVFTCSMAALVPIPGAAIYVTAKAALVGLAETIRGELAGERIGVSAFCPGPVRTNIRESGRTRPERYRHDSGYLELERQLEERPDSPHWLDPLECGRRVVEGIRRNDLYILTHPEFDAGVEERFRAIRASFPREPLNDERAEAISFLLSNPVFRAESEKLSR